jgi:type IV pilus assembly protein PilC
MMVWVVPQFESMYASMLQGASLPALTQAVVRASRWIASSGGWVLLGVAIGIPGIAALSKVDAWVRWKDRWLLSIPIAGSLGLDASLARFCRSLSTLLESAVPMLDALDTAIVTLQNRALEQRLQRVRERVRDGCSIAHCFEQDSSFPGVLGGMVAVGESTGSLSTMLLEVAQLFEAEVETRMESLLTLLEPALILLLALSIGFLVIALFLPMVELMQRLGV